MAKHPDLQPMKSSMFTGQHYDPTTSKLTVQYAGGDVWQYDDVPLEKAHTFAGSASPGSYFNGKIKGLYNGRKL